MLKSKRFWHFFSIKKNYPESALGGGLVRPRRSGIPLQKERGMSLLR